MQLSTEHWEPFPWPALPVLVWSAPRPRPVSVPLLSALRSPSTQPVQQRACCPLWTPGCVVPEMLLLTRVLHVVGQILLPVYCSWPVLKVTLPSYLRSKYVFGKLSSSPPPCKPTPSVNRRFSGRDTRRRPEHRPDLGGLRGKQRLGALVEVWGLRQGFALVCSMLLFLLIIVTR